MLLVNEIDLAGNKDARIVGATGTRTFLRPLEFAAFDVAIIDEASMILQPAVFHAAGLDKFFHFFPNAVAARAALKQSAPGAA